MLQCISIATLFTLHPVLYTLQHRTAFRELARRVHPALQSHVLQSQVSDALTGCHGCSSISPRSWLSASHPLDEFGRAGNLYCTLPHV